MSELSDRLEALAARGRRRGADDVLRAARADVTSRPDAAGPDDDAFADDELPIIGDEIPFVAPDPARSRGRRYGSLIAAVGIAALVGVGTLAIAAVFGNGGADSPEAAVRQLASAVNHEDPLAAVDVLTPSEVRSMRATVSNASQQAADLKLVADASRPLAGVDLSVDNLSLTTETLSDGYAKVVITGGELSSGAHRAELSALIQKAMSRGGPDGQYASDPSGKADLSQLAAAESLPTFVVAVRHDGGWYVSPAYTALEYIREINNYPAADFGSAKTAPVGADTPELAVSDALRAWQANDWDRLLALAPPSELPVYDYRAMIDTARGDIRSDFTIDQLSTTADVSGDSATVKLDASGTWGSDPTRKWQVGGTCASGGWFGFSDSSSPDSGNDSSGGSPDLCLSGDLGGTVPVGLVATSEMNAQTSGPVSVSVVRENGRWFVSPVTTALGVLDSTIGKIDQRTVYGWLNLAYELPPDGTITVDESFRVPAASASFFPSQVYAFDGQAGQEVVGVVDSPSRNGTDSSFEYSGQVYTTDGDEIGYLSFDGYPSSVKLPKTASYRLVLSSYNPPVGGATLTMWDLAHAPKSVQDQVAKFNDGSRVGIGDNGSIPGLGDTCTTTGDVQMCKASPGIPEQSGGWSSSKSSSSVGVPPTTSSVTPPSLQP